VRLHDADGAEGVGYTYTVGRNGGAIADILRRELPELIEGQQAEDRSHLAARLVGASLRWTRRANRSGALRGRYRPLGPEGAACRVATLAFWAASTIAFLAMQAALTSICRSMIC
jgi:hypothetical protein